MFGWLQNGFLQQNYLWFQKRFMENLNLTHDEGPLGWSRDLTSYETGQFCIAAIQANTIMEDYCQVEIGPSGLFVGIYDGHRGIETSEYMSTNFFPNLIRRIQENSGDVSEDVLRKALADTEEGFLSMVANGYAENPVLGKVGSCCVTGIIWNGNLFIANIGDSLATIGRENRGRLSVEPLTTEHHCDNGLHMRALKDLHHDDPGFILTTGGVRVKGISKMTRTIGDAYLKRLPFTTLDPNFPKFVSVPDPFDRPLLTSEPHLFSKVIEPNEKFIIFASHGFWKLLKFDEIATIMNNNPRQGIEKRLRRAALESAAAKNGEILFEELRELPEGPSRRKFHDDITVVVVFLDQKHWWQRWNKIIPQMSYRGVNQTVE